MRVTSSAYSRSPPTGMPRAIRVTLPTLPAEALVEVHRGRLALEGRVGGEDHLGEGRRLGGLVDPLQELGDAEPVRADAIDRRDRAVEHVVEAAELAGPFEREDVERLLDDAQPASSRARVAADRAERRVADVEAALAEHDLVAGGDERRGERPRLRVRGAEDVVGQALRRLRADAGQAVERLDQLRDGLDEQGCHARGSVSGPGGRRGRRATASRPSSARRAGATRRAPR